MSWWNRRKTYWQKKIDKVRPTGRVIDMTHRRWGHNFYILHWFSDPANSFHAATWVTPGAEVGDTLRWKTEYGFCEGIIFEVEGARSVHDMYFIDVHVVNRIFRGDEG